MKSNRLLVIVVLAVFGLSAGGAIYWGYQTAQRRAEATREASKMLYLRVALAPKLENYYQAHGRFPAALLDLDLKAFEWGEGSSPADLKVFSYSSDGQSFIMRWHGRTGYSAYLSGEKGVIKYFEDETPSKTGK